MILPMKKTPSRLAIIPFVLLAAAFLPSCGASGGDPAVVKPALASAAASATAKKRPRHALDGRHVAILAGEAYADKASFSALEDEYGLVGDGGMLLFADSVKEVVEDSALTAIIAVGAPERTARALESLRSARPDVAIVSVFPSDEVLSVEAVSTLVIDVPVASEILAGETGTPMEAISGKDLSFLLLAAALYAELPAGDALPPAKFEAALELARKAARNPVAARDWKISQFVDTDSGLKALNHLVIDIPREGEP